MCGIIAVLNKNNKCSNIADILVKGLKRLEYRGYDSAGIAIIDSSKSIQRIRSIGEVDNLNSIVDPTIVGSIGIAHTRWATHGEISIKNAHPHKTGIVSVVHNGIVENYNELKKIYLEDVDFESETDTEVISALINKFAYNDGLSFEEAFKKTIELIRGMYAIVAISEDEPNTLLGAKRGSPLAIGYSDDAIYIASDAIALTTISKNIIYLGEEDFVIVQNNSFRIYNKSQEKVVRKEFPITISISSLDKSKYEDYMLSEIHEGPDVLIKTYDNFYAPLDVKHYNSFYIIACGTSYYAGLLAKYLIEDIAKIQVHVEIASEFRYRNPMLPKDALYMFISQSGETIDTLCSMRNVIERKLDTLSIVNVPNSSIARESKYTIETHAGVEIGVASTKAFISQVLTLLLLIIDKRLINIELIANHMQKVLDKKSEFESIATEIANSLAIMYMGRGTSYPIAMEGALKMKELSYISSEGFPSGEIKHGPIALIDKKVNSIILAPNDRYYEKTISNAEEILARNGAVYLLGHSLKSFKKNMTIININSAGEIGSPFILASAVHLLAYYTAKVKGLNIDKPRNLAKSVTVE